MLPFVSNWQGEVHFSIFHKGTPVVSTHSRFCQRPFSERLSRMEQVNATSKAYHWQMKRELPVTSCTVCGCVGYQMRAVNGRCCKTIGNERCIGVNAIANKTLDWNECPQCQASGYYRNKVCPNCNGAGFLFVGLRDAATI